MGTSASVSARDVETVSIFEDLSESPDVESVPSLDASCAIVRGLGLGFEIWVWDLESGFRGL